MLFRSVRLCLHFLVSFSFLFFCTRIMAAQNPIFKALHHFKVEEIGSNANIVTIHEGKTIEDAVNVMAQNRITSAPIVSKDGNVLGDVDMLDIVHHIVKVSPDEWCISHDCLRSLEIAGRAIALETISEIINASGRDPYVPVYENDPITEAIAHFARGVHRIAIVDRQGLVKHSLSQTDLARLLVEELKKSPSKHISEKSVKELGLGSFSPLIASENQTVLDALKKINENSVSALAIVHPHSGKLAGNFSATDLVGLYRNQLPDLLVPLVEYLNKYSEKSLSPITIRQETSLLEAVQVMNESHIHRVWVIDDDFKPVGVVSMTDVARFIQTYVYE